MGTAHNLLTLSGCVVASVVTAGDRDDSPVLTELTEMAPMGNGYLIASTVAKRTAKPSV